MSGHTRRRTRRDQNRTKLQVNKKEGVLFFFFSFGRNIKRERKGKEPGKQSSTKTKNEGFHFLQGKRTRKKRKQDVRLSLIISWIVAAVTRWHQHFQRGSSKRCPANVVRSAQTRHNVFSLRLSHVQPIRHQPLDPASCTRLLSSKSQVILLCGLSDNIEGNSRLIRCHHSRVLGQEVSKITRYVCICTVPDHSWHQTCVGFCSSLDLQQGVTGG